MGVPLVGNLNILPPSQKIILLEFILYVYPQSPCGYTLSFAALYLPAL